MNSSLQPDPELSVQSLKSALYNRLVQKSLIHSRDMRTVNSDHINEKDVELFKAYKEKSFSGHKKQPGVLAWNQEGNVMVTAETVVKVWAFNEQWGLEILNQIKGHDTMVTQAGFFTDHTLMTMSKEVLKFWDIRGSSIKAIRTEKKLKSDFMNISWGHESATPHFTILSKDGQIGTYDFRSSSLSQPLHSVKPQFQINEIMWDYTDSVLIASYLEGGSGYLTLFDSKLQPIPENLQIHNGRINSFAIGGQNDCLVTCSEDSLLQVHCLPQLICTNAYSNTDTPYKKVTVSHNSEYAAASCEEPNIHFYNLKTGGYAFKLPVSSSGQEALAWHPKRLILAYVDQEEKRKSEQVACIKLFSPS